MFQNTMLKILIIDDHPLVADGIKTMLKDVDHLHISGNCRTGKEALEFPELHTIDIILLDINLSDMDGLHLCEMLRKQNVKAKILGLTSVNETSIITGLLHRGGNGYLLKNMERKELLHAITMVIEGGIYLSKDANEKVLEQFRNISTALDSIPVLTRREKEILQLLADGLKGPQIAEKLFLSPYTVETHRKNLLKKFNANNSQILLKIAREYKMLN
jgi:two-component system nitrate/nitrite response regulator NarL